MFGYESITVSFAWELISVSMCYSQGDGFNTSLSRLFMYCTHALLPLPTSLCNVLGVVVGGTVMCYPGRR